MVFVTLYIHMHKVTNTMSTTILTYSFAAMLDLFFILQKNLIKVYEAMYHCNDNLVCICFIACFISCLLEYQCINNCCLTDIYYAPCYKKIKSCNN